MARYIDADNLYRRVKEKTNPYGKPLLDYQSGIKVLDMIEQEPTADVVEVVRCKNCVDYIPNADLDHEQMPNDLEADGYCDNWLKYTDAHCFCSSGRKEIKERFKE